MNFFGTHTSGTTNLLDLIEQHAITLDSNSNEYMCKFSSDIVKNYTEKWSINRNLIKEKIKDIERQLRDKTILETVLYLVYIENHDKFIVFDGNHRRQALINRYNMTGINVSVFCYIYKLDVDFEDTATLDQKIVEKFKIINNNTPIPEEYYKLYENIAKNGNQEDRNLVKSRIAIVEDLLLEFKKNYNSFYSLSNNPYKPNFNDTMFSRLCYEFEFTNKEELVNQLNTINIHNKSNREQSGLSPRNLNKCIQYDFYLFLFK